MSINFFNSMEHLEPKCKSCKSKIDYGITTTWDDDKEGHVCNSCGCLVD